LCCVVLNVRESSGSPTPVLWQIINAVPAFRKKKLEDNSKHVCEVRIGLNLIFCGQKKETEYDWHSNCIYFAECLRNSIEHNLNTINGIQYCYFQFQILNHHQKYISHMDYLCKMLAWWYSPWQNASLMIIHYLEVKCEGFFI
jgi:hypothetical protein